MRLFCALNLAFSLQIGLLASPVLLADDGQMHPHQHVADHGKAPPQSAGGATKVPRLRILFPRPHAKVGTQLAVVFETPGDLSKLTMSAANMNTHLHIETDGVTLMPTENQIIRLGDEQYLFVFDLPVPAGEHRIRVFWADARHETIDSSVQSVEVNVVGTTATVP